MIREILEKNGFTIKETIIKGTFDENKYCDIFNSDLSTIPNGFVTRIEFIKSLEQACREYIKNNGFKLSWLEKEGIYTNDGRPIWDMFCRKGSTYKNKLIAWLYANDIKIINDLD